MSKIAGRMRAILGLDKRQFDAGLKGAQSRVERFSRSMRSVGRRLSVATAGVAAGMGVAVRSSLGTIDAQAKMAESLDTSVVSIQNLTRASDLAGISQGDLDGSLRRVTRRVSLAAKGTGPAVKALERLNLSAADLNGLPVDERVNKINQAIRDMIPEAQQAGIASEIFGDKTGLAMLRLNPDVIRQASDEVKKFGVNVSDVDADQIERTNDAISAIGLVSKGLGNQLAVALAPVLEKVANFAADVAARFQALSPEMKRMVGIGVAVAAAIGPLAVGLGFVAAGLAALASPVGLVIFGLGAVAGAAAYVVTQWDDLKARFPMLEKLGDIGSWLSEQWGKLPSIKWALLIPALRWARFIPGLRWAAFIPKIGWAVAAGALKWGALIGRLSWTALGVIPKIGWAVAAGALKWGALIGRLSWAALRVIPGIGWAALAGSLAWSLLIKKIEWNGWIPSVVWADWITNINWRDWIPKINWPDWIPSVDWGRVFGDGKTVGSRARKAGRDAAQGLAEGIEQGRATVGSAGRAAMREAIDAAEDEGEIKSPSRVFMRIGRDLMAGLGIGVGQNTGLATDALREGVGRMQDQLKGLGKGSDAAAKRFGDMAAGIITGSQKIGDVLSQMGNRLLSSGLGALGSSLFPSLFGGGGLFAGLFDKGGFIPRGQFGIAGELGPEIVTGPARVTSRVDTARIMARADASRNAASAQALSVTITMDESTGAMGAFVRDQAGRVVAQAAPRIVGQAVGATYERAREHPIGRR